MGHRFKGQTTGVHRADPFKRFRFVSDQNNLKTMRFYSVQLFFHLRANEMVEERRQRSAITLYMVQGVYLVQLYVNVEEIQVMTPLLLCEPGTGHEGRKN